MTFRLKRKGREPTWTHRGCGGDVVWERSSSGEGYKCRICGFIPESEVETGTVFVEEYEEVIK